MDGIPDGSKKCLSSVSHILRNLLDAIDSNNNNNNELPDSEKRDYSSIVEFLHDQSFHPIVISVITKLTITNFLEEDEAIICNLLFSSATYARNLVYGDVEDAFDNYVGVKVITRLIRQLLYHPANERHMTPV